jgi:hypothetical protein
MKERYGETFDPPPILVPHVKLEFCWFYPPMQNRFQRRRTVI